MQVSQHPTLSGYRASVGDGFEPAHVANMRELALLSLQRTWSPIIWNGGVRRGEFFQQAEVVALDFDVPGFSIAEAVAVSESLDLSYFVGVTRSHLKEKRGVVCERFRWVFAAAGVTTSADEYCYNMKLLQQKFPTADKSGKDAARFFFPCSAIVAGNADAGAYEWLSIPKNYAEKTARAATIHRTQRGKIPKNIANWLKNGARGGQSRHEMCSIIGLALAQRGFSIDEISDLIRESPLATIITDDPKHWQRTIEWGFKTAGETSGTGTTAEADRQA